MKVLFSKFRRSLTMGGKKMAEVCNLCRNGIGEEFKTEFYRLNGKVYCGTRCYEDDRNAENKEGSSAKVADNNKANKDNKRSNKVQSKGKQQKKRKTK